MVYRSYLTALGSTLALVVAAIGAFNFVVDPFQYYRVPTLYVPVYFSGVQRVQNVGLARTQTYDTVVIGSSVTENFLPSYIERSWGVQAVKLSISGSTSREQYLVLAQALRTGQVKHVIWGLDAASFYQPPYRVRDEDMQFPHYMYRDVPFANVEYLFSLATLRRSIRALVGGGETDLDRLDTWHWRFEFGAAALLKAWGRRCDAFEAKYRGGEESLSAVRLSQMRASIDLNLVGVVGRNPDVTFHLFFPPASILNYIPAKSAALPVVIPFKVAVMNALIDEPNVRFSDFQLVTPIIEDLQAYKDPLHFGLPVSEYIIDALRDSTHRVGRGDIEPGIAALVERVNKYDLCSGGRSLAELK